MVGFTEFVNDLNTTGGSPGFSIENSRQIILSDFFYQKVWKNKFKVKIYSFCWESNPGRIDKIESLDL